MTREDKNKLNCDAQELKFTREKDDTCYIIDNQ